MKVFADTNVLASALTTHGLCVELLRHLLEKPGIELVVTSAVRAELERILRNKFGRELSSLPLTRELLARLVTTATEPHELPVALSDPDDVPIVASALSTGAEYFVTGDKALQNVGKIGDMVIVSPREMFERLVAGN